MTGNPFREAKLPVDGEPVRAPRRSRLVYILSGVAIVIDLGAFVVLAKTVYGEAGRSPPEDVALVCGYGLALVVGLAIVSVLALRYRRERAQLGTLVRRSNAAAPENVLGLFEGVIVEGDEGTFLSHVSETPAVYSEVTVEHYVRQGNASSWQTVGTRTAGVEFLLDDETGAPLVVDPSDVPVVTAAMDPAHVEAPTLSAIYTDLGLNPEIVVRDSINYRWYERVLVAGDRVAIIGRVRDRTGEARRLDIEPGASITGGGAASLAALTGSMEKALVVALVPFGVVAVAVSVIGLLMSGR